MAGMTRGRTSVEAKRPSLRCHHDKKADEKETDEERRLSGATSPVECASAKDSCPPRPGRSPASRSSKIDGRKLRRSAPEECNGSSGNAASTLSRSLRA